MRSTLIFFLPPILGAFIGYLTNYVAVKLLFHPKEPKTILGVRIQGLIPARAEKIADTILASVEEFLTEDDFKELIKSALEKSLKEKSKKLSFLENYGFFERLSGYLGKVVDGFVEQLSSSIARNVELREVVKRKVENFSSEDAELYFKRMAGRELRFIEISGAVLGFLIGLVQSLIFLVAH